MEEDVRRAHRVAEIILEAWPVPIPAFGRGLVELKIQRHIDENPAQAAILVAAIRAALE